VGAPQGALRLQGAPALPRRTSVRFSKRETSTSTATTASIGPPSARSRRRGVSKSFRFATICSVSRRHAGPFATCSAVDSRQTWGST
jgi:hypothetical protein